MVKWLQNVAEVESLYKSLFLSALAWQCIIFGPLWWLTFIDIVYLLYLEDSALNSSTCFRNMHLTFQFKRYLIWMWWFKSLLVSCSVNTSILMPIHVLFITHQAAIALIPREVTSLLLASLLHQIDLLRLFLRVFSRLWRLLVEDMADTAFCRVACWVLVYRAVFLWAVALLQLLTVTIEVMLLCLLLLFKRPCNKLVLDLRRTYRMWLLPISTPSLISSFDLLGNLNVKRRCGSSGRLGRWPAEVVLPLSESNSR